jgi:hypothetical protein
MGSQLHIYFRGFSIRIFTDRIKRFTVLMSVKLDLHYCMGADDVLCGLLFSFISGKGLLHFKHLNLNL